MLGGGLRQAGIAAAAGLYALDHHIERLAEDHAHARFLAESLSGCTDVQIDMNAVETNMVFLTLPQSRGALLQSALAEDGITISGPDLYTENATFRLVMHLDCSREAVEKLSDAIQAFLRK